MYCGVVLTDNNSNESGYHFLCNDCADELDYREEKKRGVERRGKENLRGITEPRITEN